MTHPYFTAKARSVFARAGGDPDKSGPLAAWAEAARNTRDSRDGVIVTEDGELIARTRHTRDVGTYVYGLDTTPGEGRCGEILDVSMARLAREHGQAMIHVTYSDVCLGAGQYA